MSHPLRDLFAAHALQGLAGRARTVGVRTEHIDLGREAYALADAAIAAGQEQPAAGPPPAYAPGPQRPPAQPAQRAQGAPALQQQPPSSPDAGGNVGGPPPGFQGFQRPPGQ